METQLSPGPSSHLPEITEEPNYQAITQQKQPPQQSQQLMPDSSAIIYQVRQHTHAFFNILLQHTHAFFNILLFCFEPLNYAFVPRPILSFSTLKKANEEWA